MAFDSESNNLLTASADGSLRRWDIRSGISVELLDSNEEWVVVALSRDHRHLASWSTAGTLSAWNVNTGTRIVQHGATSAARSISIHTSARVLAAGLADGTVLVAFLDNEPFLHVLEGHKGDVVGVSFNDTGTRLVTSSSDGTVRLWDTSTGEELLILASHDERISFAEFSVDGTRIIAGAHDGTIWIWDSKSTRQRHSDRRRIH